jgi:hypothetical protein
VSELEAQDWLALSPGDYSFQLFQFLKFDPDLMQTTLELRTAHARLDMIWSILQEA